MEEEEEKDTTYCSNCERYISTSAYQMHEVHCFRNIILCHTCREPVPRIQMEEHIQENHTQTNCELCGKSVMKDQLENHQTEDCLERKVPCKFCDLEIKAIEFQEHAATCGSRTDVCDKCLQRVLLRDMEYHHDNECGKPHLSPPKPHPSLRPHPSPPSINPYRVTPRLVAMGGAVGINIGGLRPSSSGTHYRVDPSIPVMREKNITPPHPPPLVGVDGTNIGNDIGGITPAVPDTLLINDEEIAHQLNAQFQEEDHAHRIKERDQIPSDNLLTQQLQLEDRRGLRGLPTMVLYNRALLNQEDENSINEVPSVLPCLPEQHPHEPGLPGPRPDEPCLNEEEERRRRQLEEDERIANELQVKEDREMDLILNRNDPPLRPSHFNRSPSPPYYREDKEEEGERERQLREDERMAMELQNNESLRVYNTSPLPPPLSSSPPPPPPTHVINAPINAPQVKEQEEEVLIPCEMCNQKVPFELYEYHMGEAHPHFRGYFNAVHSPVERMLPRIPRDPPPYRPVDRPKVPRDPPPYRPIVEDTLGLERPRDPYRPVEDDTLRPERPRDSYRPMGTHSEEPVRDLPLERERDTLNESPERDISPARFSPLTVPLTVYKPGATISDDVPCKYCGFRYTRTVMDYHESICDCNPDRKTTRGRSPSPPPPQPLAIPLLKNDPSGESQSEEEEEATVHDITYSITGEKEEEEEEEEREEREEDKLPCQFCDQLIPYNNFDHHQNTCTERFKPRHIDWLNATNTTVTNNSRSYIHERKEDTPTTIQTTALSSDDTGDEDGEENDCLPCQFCDKPIPINKFERHQTNCPKRFDTLTIKCRYCNKEVLINDLSHHNRVACAKRPSPPPLSTRSPIVYTQNMTTKGQYAGRFTAAPFTTATSTTGKSDLSPTFTTSLIAGGRVNDKPPILSTTNTLLHTSTFQPSIKPSLLTTTQHEINTVAKKSGSTQGRNNYQEKDNHSDDEEDDMIERDKGGRSNFKTNTSISRGAKMTSANSINKGPITSTYGKRTTSNTYGRKATNSSYAREPSGREITGYSQVPTNSTYRKGPTATSSFGREPTSSSSSYTKGPSSSSYTKGPSSSNHRRGTYREMGRGRPQGGRGTRITSTERTQPHHGDSNTPYGLFIESSEEEPMEVDTVPSYTTDDLVTDMRHVTIHQSNGRRRHTYSSGRSQSGRK